MLRHGLTQVAGTMPGMFNQRGGYTVQDFYHDLRFWLECSRKTLFRTFIHQGGRRSIFRGVGDEAFIYIPGTRTDRVLLVAHTDTVWDRRPSYPAPVRYENGRYFSSVATQGIGADDRAGCAMLWYLRDLGHSLLLTSGEESGCRGSRWIMENNPDIAESLQAHQFMIQFDRRGDSEFKCYSVGSSSFRSYIQKMTGYTEPDRLSRTDIVVLARDICAANFSIGYYHEHTVHEYLEMAEWETTMSLMRSWLSGSQLPRHERVLARWGMATAAQDARQAVGDRGTRPFRQGTGQGR